MSYKDFIPEDPTRLLRVHGRKAKEAFDIWKNGWERPQDVSAQDTYREFSAIIARRMGLSAREVEKTGLPLSKSDWSRVATGKKTLNIRLDVCWQVFFVSGVDVTHNGVLPTAPLNGTSMVTLGPVRIARKTPRGSLTYSIDWVTFQATPETDIVYADIKRRPLAADHESLIGTVRYFLRGASLSLKNVSDFTPYLRRIGDGRSNEYGAADGLEISLDHEGVGRWRIERPVGREGLQGRLDKILLGAAECENLSPVVSPENRTPRIEISASISDIQPEVSTERDFEISQMEYANLRRRLREQIMRNRIKDAGHAERFVLSVALKTSQA